MNQTHNIDCQKSDNKEDMIQMIKEIGDEHGIKIQSVLTQVVFVYIEHLMRNAGISSLENPQKDARTGKKNK